MFDVLNRKFRVHRQRNVIGCNVFADRKITFLVTKISISLLQVQRNRIVQAILDALFRQGLAERLAIFYHDYIEVVNMLRARRLLWRGDFTAREQFVVPLGQGASILIPTIEMRELHSKDTALNAFEAQVIGGKIVLILLDRAVIPEHAYFLASSELFVVTAPPSPQAPRFLLG